MKVFHRRRQSCARTIEIQVPDCRGVMAKQWTAQAGSIVTFVQDDGSQGCCLLADPSPLPTPVRVHGLEPIVSVRSPLGSAIQGATAGERRMYLFAGRVRSVSITMIEPA